jgi:heme exporter protein C
MSIESKPAPTDVTLTSDDRATVVAKRRISPLAIVTVGMLAVFAYFAFVFAPEDALQGAMQRIFYIHVPSAWVCFMAFFVTFCASIGYLNNRSERWDMVAASSAEIGTIFTTVVLITGMMWGHAIWGVYWTWEPRLTSFLVLCSCTSATSRCAPTCRTRRARLASRPSSASSRSSTSRSSTCR